MKRPDQSIEKLRASAEKSRRLLPAHSLFTAVTAGISIALEHWLDASWVVHLLVLWVGPFTLTVDLINIAQCRRAMLRKGEWASS